MNINLTPAQKTERAVTHENRVTLTYNPADQKDVEWAVKMNSRLGQRGYELAEWHAGRAIYLKLGVAA